MSGPVSSLSVKKRLSLTTPRSALCHDRCRSLFREDAHAYAFRVTTPDSRPASRINNQLDLLSVWPDGSDDECAKQLPAWNWAHGMGVTGFRLVATAAGSPRLCRVGLAVGHCFAAVSTVTGFSRVCMALSCSEVSGRHAVRRRHGSQRLGLRADARRHPSRTSG